MSNSLSKSGISKPSLGIILPTLNAAQSLDRVLQSLSEGACLFDMDVIVADGGSTDRTVDIAQRHDARVLEAEGGWYAQVVSACRMIWGQWVMLLSDDVGLRSGWSTNLRLFTDATGDHDFAAHGRFQDMAPGRFPFLRRVPAGQVGLVLKRTQLETILTQARPGSLRDDILIDRLDRRRLVQLPYVLQKVAGSNAHAA